jgi:hypothetical protein
MAPANSQEPCSLAQLLAYFLRLGTFGFGGPIALAGRMDRDLVEERGWVSRQDYVEGLAFSQLSPGPLAAQLAMYLGWVRAGQLGAALVAAAFIAPSFLIVSIVSPELHENMEFERPSSYLPFRAPCASHFGSHGLGNIQIPSRTPIGERGYPTPTRRPATLGEAAQTDLYRSTPLGVFVPGLERLAICLGHR